MVGSHLIKWCDSGLDNRRTHIDGYGIAPTFEIMGRGELIGTQISSFVALLTDLDRAGHLLHRVGYIQRAWCGIGRIGIEDDKRVDCARMHVIDKGGERSEGGESLSWLSEFECST